MISKLQYISQGTSIEEHLNNIKSACEAGIKWVQLRIKKQPESIVLESAFLAKEICDKYGAKLIINDYPGIALKVKAHGVHVGKEDISVKEARKIAGPERIIGGTANTLEDILKHVQDGADYVGLGPFRFTKTKENISPVLGLAGYQQLTEILKIQNVTIPLIGIGGIELADVEELLNTGIYGIAVSSLITNSGNRATLVKQIQQQLNKDLYVNYCQ